MLGTYKKKLVYSLSFLNFYVYVLFRQIYTLKTLIFIHRAKPSS